MTDLDLLRKAVNDSPFEDTPLAALVDALIEAGYDWEAGVWQAELVCRKDYSTADWPMIRTFTLTTLALGPDVATAVLGMVAEAHSELAT